MSRPKGTYNYTYQELMRKYWSKSVSIHYHKKRSRKQRDQIKRLREELFIAKRKIKLLESIR